MEGNNKIPTLIINLASSNDRKKYMKEVIKNYPVLESRFIEAVDGRILPSNQLNEKFDTDKCIKKYGRDLNRGEIGCTLSHRKCYEEIIKSDIPYCLILEDDITIIRNINDEFDEKLKSILLSNNPAIIFLSGDYWRLNNKNICPVFAAVGSYAYLINKKAAECILNVKKPFNVADDWDFYKQLGVNLFAKYPYLIDANLENLSSDINQEHWGYLKKKLSLKYLLRGYYTGVIKYLLVKFRLFESKRR